MTAILDKQTLSTPLVLQQAVSTTEWKVVRIEEDIRNRQVTVQLDLGPFITEPTPEGAPEGFVPNVRATGRRGVTVWENDAYDVVRDTWTNADLLAAIPALLV